eukprot:CAMPEP_0184480226 /NCGR_PEP_ID=MMETSP0113_2-20130426/1712_1 /TAXON_ID=91329 /ORGANISM="Norrisiella sphaerica, Strain BC52" /LENGTH=259 /DNA_ID=CAMNT_0026858563 /DNA_START=14 /DNA_END=793 /DNA_ORIENTATION=-
MGFLHHHSRRGAVAALAATIAIVSCIAFASQNYQHNHALEFGVVSAPSRFVAGPTTTSNQRSVSANAQLYFKKYQVVGVNHRVGLEGKSLNFMLGNDGAKSLQVPDNVEVRCPRNNEVHIASADKDKVLEFSEAVQALKEDSGKEGVRRVGKGVRIIDSLDPVHEKKLKLVGVGYRAAVKGNTIVLNIGYSHPVTLPILEGVKIDCPSNTEIVLSGKDKWAVGQMAYNIREWRKPEPYKGKGIRYEGERILMKEGKRKK